jgi:tight adherence protein C
VSAATLILVVGMFGIFIALFVSLTAIGVFDNEARGVSKSLAVVEAFSAAPQAMQQELEPSFQDRVLVPLLDRFVDIGRKFTPADHNDRVRQKLERAGNPPGWTVDRVTSLKVVGFGGMLGLSILFTLALGTSLGLSLVVAGAAAVAGYFAPNMYLHQRGADRAEAMRKTFPDALDLLTISVEAGLGFDAALSHVAKNIEGPLADEFARVLQEMQIGLGRAGALRALGERTTLEEMRGFVSAMVQADAFGIPIGKVLRVQSSEIRVKRRQRAEEQAQKLPVKILFPLVLFILPCLFIVVLGPAAISIVAMFTSEGV